MLHIACSGFPLPVSRYWDLFGSVEISDTELGIPGAGTTRRWLRESPDGFAFTALAPKVFAESGFSKTKDNKALAEAFAEFAERVSAEAVIFQHTEFKHNKANRTTLKAFVNWLPKTLPQIVIDLPEWKPEQVVDACAGKVIAAYDPLVQGPPAGDMLYARLPGPAGHRSRYDEDSIAAIAAHCEEHSEAEGFLVFRNIDMQTNGTALRQKLGV